MASVLVSKQSSQIRRIPNWNCSGSRYLHAEAGPFMGGARRRGPRCAGRKYHRSDRGHGIGGYEQHGNLFTHLLRAGCRRQSCHHHPHGHGNGQPHRGSECHRGDGYDLVSAGHFYHGQSDHGLVDKMMKTEHNVSLTKGFYPR